MCSSATKPLPRGTTLTFLIESALPLRRSRGRAVGNQIYRGSCFNVPTRSLRFCIMSTNPRGADEIHQILPLDRPAHRRERRADDGHTPLFVHDINADDASSFFTQFARLLLRRAEDDAPLVLTPRSVIERDDRVPFAD